MDIELKALRKELSLLENDLGTRVKSIEQRIAALENQQIWSHDAIAQKASITPDIDRLEALVETSSASLSQPSPFTPPEDIKTLNVDDWAQGVSKKAAVDTQAATPNKAEASRSIYPALGQTLSTILAMVLGPFAGFLQQFMGLYQHYKQQGKAPVFFMTLAGIVALVCSFSYLLQYSFNEFLGPISKVVLGFIVALAVTVGGAIFTKRMPSMAEYGSSIIALGIVLNYLCAYFAGPYYDLLPQTLGFLLLVAVSAIAFILALLFETRVVAIVTIIGGATMPLIMQHIDHSPFLYLSYLWVLVMAMLYLSCRIHWPRLAMVSLSVAVIMIEYSIFNRSMIDASAVNLIMLIHGFFYGCAWYIFHTIKSEGLMNKVTLFMMSSNLLFYIFFQQQLSPSSQLLGAVLAVNILPWVAVFFWSHKILRSALAEQKQKSVQVVALLYAGVLAAVAVLMIASPEMRGAIWAVEGLMLIYLGIRFEFTSVRVEGYIAFVIALFGMLIQFLGWLISSFTALPELMLLVLSPGWGNLIAITFFLFVALQLLQRNREGLSGSEIVIAAVLENSFWLFLSLSFLLSVGLFSTQIMWLIAVIPMFTLIYYGNKNQRFITEIIGGVHLLFIAVPIFISASLLSNFHFSEQSIYAQIARVEVFLCLWLVAEFYKRCCQNSRLFTYSENLRKLFYLLIPVFFLPSVLRKYVEFFPVVLWGSSAMALFLYYRLQYSVLKLELRILFIVASLAAICVCALQKFDDWQGYASPALLLGMAVFIVLLWLGQGLRRLPEGDERKINLYHALRPLIRWGVYYWGIALFILVYGLSANVGGGLVIALLYFTSLYIYKPALVLIRGQLRLMYSVNFILFVVLTLMHLEAATSHAWDALWLGLFNAIACVCIALLVYFNRPQSIVVWRATGRQLAHQCLFHLTCIIAYSALLMQLFSTMQGPLISFSLVLHATVLLFQSLQPKMKKIIWLSLSIFALVAVKIFVWDLQDFSMIQKIVVFMLIGAAMLAAAFKYQKMLPQINEERCKAG